MKESFAYAFYTSWEWRKCRAAYLKKQPLCERCGQPATQVHHKIKLTPDNIRQPSISLSFDNLEALCDFCHQQEHKPQIRWRCDEMGHVQL
jgi:5-methylcytosine-specific restriction endonuclease McrA